MLPIPPGLTRTHITRAHSTELLLVSSSSCSVTKHAPEPRLGETPGTKWEFLYGRLWKRFKCELDRSLTDVAPDLLLHAYYVHAITP